MLIASSLDVASLVSTTGMPASSRSSLDSTSVKSSLPSDLALDIKSAHAIRHLHQTTNRGYQVVGLLSTFLLRNSVDI